MFQRDAEVRPALVPKWNRVETLKLAQASTEMTENDGWYYRSFDIDFGPVTFEELVELAKSHTISHDDQIRLGEKGIWRRAGSMGKLMAHLPYKAGGIELTNKSDADFELQSLESSVEQPATNSLLDLDMSHLEDIDELDLNSLEDIDADNVQVAEPPQIKSGWWCKIKDKEYGPVDWPKVVEWVTAGRLSRNDQVRFGQEPYILACELPNLFPQAPVAKVVESKTVANASETASIPVATPKPIEAPAVSKQVAAAATVTIAPRAASMTTSPKTTTTSPPKTAPPKPVSNPQPKPVAPMPTSAVSKGADSKSSQIRPAASPVRPSATRTSSPIDFSRLLIPLGVVVGGIVVVGALIYFGMQLAPVNTAADVNRFKTLQKSFGELIIARTKGHSKPELLKNAQESIATAAKSVLAELKEIPNKNFVQGELQTVARKMQDVSKEELGEKVSAIETATSEMLNVVEKRLKLR